MLFIYLIDKEGLIMKYTVNTKQRLYIYENKFSIVIYKKLSINVYKQSNTISLDFYDKNIYRRTFSADTYKAIKKNVGCLLLAVSCELLLTKYYEDVLRIIKNNSKYIHGIFKQLM